MIRKAIILISVFLALVMGALWIWSLRGPKSWYSTKAPIPGTVGLTLKPGRLVGSCFSPVGEKNFVFRHVIHTPRQTSIISPVSRVQPLTSWWEPEVEHIGLVVSVVDVPDQYELLTPEQWKWIQEHGLPAPGGGLYYHIQLTNITCPLLIPLLLFASYPTIAFIRGPLRRYRRRRKGLCLRCGYDLTGNVTGICSECGHSIFPEPITTEQETD